MHSIDRSDKRSGRSSGDFDERRDEELEERKLLTFGLLVFWENMIKDDLVFDSKLQEKNWVEMYLYHELVKLSHIIRSMERFLIWD